jgi:hypothetical protein
MLHMSSCWGRRFLNVVYFFPSRSWVVDTYFSESDIARLLKLGVYSPKYMAEGAIDTKADRLENEKFR